MVRTLHQAESMTEGVSVRCINARAGGWVCFLVPYLYKVGNIQKHNRLTRNARTKNPRRRRESALDGGANRQTKSEATTTQCAADTKHLSGGARTHNDFRRTATKKPSSGETNPKRRTRRGRPRCTLQLLNYRLHYFGA